jgi:phage gp46-like protein
MKTYQFPQEYLSPVIQHVASYGIKVLSMQPNDGNYVIQVEATELPEGEYNHLNQEYQLEEVV